MCRRHRKRKLAMYRIMEGYLQQRRLKWCAKRELWRSPPGIRVPRRLLLPLLWRLLQELAAIPRPLGNHPHLASLLRLEIGSVARVPVPQLEPQETTFATLLLTWGGVVVMRRRSQSVPTRRRGGDHGLLPHHHRRADRRTRTYCRKLGRSQEAQNCGPPCLHRSRVVRSPMVTMRVTVSLRAEGRRRQQEIKP